MGESSTISPGSASNWRLKGMVAAIEVISLKAGTAS